MNIKYSDKIENANHPQILYWFWTPDMIENHTYIEELENISKTMSFDLLFLTSRDGLSFFDFDSVAEPFRKTVERAHELNIKIGLQLWRPEDTVQLDDALALIVEGEEKLDDEGELIYEVESRGHRNVDSLKSELFKVVLFQKKGKGIYEKKSLVDAMDMCEVLSQSPDKIKIKISAGQKYGQYSAYILTSHYHRSPDLYSTYPIESFKVAIDTYAHIPFDGIGLDEYKSMPISHPKDAMWHKFRERIYGKAFDAYHKKQSGMDLKETIFEMRYVSEDEESKRMKAINYYFDTFKDGPIIVENFVYDYAKETFGQDTFIGLHNTYHNTLTNDEIWETGCMWWDMPREYGQTDEDISYPVRLGIAYSHPQSIVYDMFYTEGKQMPIYKKSIEDAKYNNRIHYHAYNDRRPNRFNMENKEFSGTITEIENKIKLLNHFDGPHPNVDLLVVFGRPALANWYPDYQHRNDYDINGGLFIMEKCDALWDAGVMCALVPSTKVETGVLKINSDNKIEYNGHVFDSMLYLYPEYSKKSTLDFLDSAADSDNNVMIVGSASKDFDGNDCSKVFNDISNKINHIEFSVENVINTGVKSTPVQNGSLLKDGSIIMSDLHSILNKKALTFSKDINGHVYSGSYIGTMAIKADVNGNIEKFTCGGFKELLRDGNKIISLKEETDVVILKSDSGYDIIIQGDESNNKLELFDM